MSKHHINFTLFTGEAHSVHTQEILFSIFCGLNVAVSYHLSRSSSDPTTIFALIKRQLMIHTHSGSVENTSVAEVEGGNNTTNVKSEEKESPGEISTNSSSSSTTLDPYPKKLRDTVHARLKSDAIICTVVFVLVTLIHWTGFFAQLQPNLNYVLWILAGILGFSLHYVLPQLRKQVSPFIFAFFFFEGLCIKVQGQPFILNGCESD